MFIFVTLIFATSSASGRQFVLEDCSRPVVMMSKGVPGYMIKSEAGVSTPLWFLSIKSLKEELYSSSPPPVSLRFASATVLGQ